jgi:excisionase family DNA binding protein
VTADRDSVGTEDLLTVVEASEILDLSIQHVNRLLEAQDLSTVRVGKADMVLRAEVEEYAARHR